MCWRTLLRHTEFEMEITMKANAIGGTARIYQFPEGGRAGLSSGRCKVTSIETHALKRMAWPTYSGASYHEDAIREEASVRKN